MSTIRQIQANQLNARQSTGPRSVQGKAAVSLNALKSGIDAQTLVIQGEDSAGFETLKAEYYDRWLPTTPEQRTLVDTLLANEWLLRRYHRLETQMWQDFRPREDRIRPDADLCQSFCNGDKFFDRMVRHRNSAQRAYHTALRDLERLKKEEVSAAPSPDPAPIRPLPPQPVDPEPAFTPIGFVPPPAARYARQPYGAVNRSAPVAVPTREHPPLPSKFPI